MDYAEWVSLSVCGLLLFSASDMEDCKVGEKEKTGYKYLKFVSLIKILLFLYTENFPWVY